MTLPLTGPEGLTADLYEAVVYGGQPVTPTPEALARVGQHRQRFLDHLATGVVCYGVNTGLGALAKTDLSPGDIAALPRQILLGRAAAFGPPLPAPVARGVLLIRLTQFLSGIPAVTPALCHQMAEGLARGLTPWIPGEGHGMAGEIIPLTHAAQPLIGEGFVMDGDGQRLPAADWLARHGLPPHEPQPKEGIALINGVAVAPARAFDLARQARHLLAHAQGIAACGIEAMAAPLEPYDADVARLRPEPMLAETLTGLRALLAGSGISRSTRQAPVSLRVTPQVHAALSHALNELARAAIAEMGMVGDNPAFLMGETPAQDRLLHCGNFHSAALTAAIEAAALALAQVALLSERRLHRLLDAKASGLSPQLALTPGLDAGLVAVHKASLGFAATLKARSLPPSLMHGDSSFGQEDMMTMALPALDRLAELLDLARKMLACEAYTAAVALDQRAEVPGAGVAARHAALRAVIPPYRGDRSYGPEIEQVVGMLD